MEKEKPIYTLEKQVVSPYNDFVKLHFNLNRTLYLVVIIFAFLVLVTNIFFNIVGPNIFSIIIYVFIGLLIVLLVFSLSILPILQMKAIKNNNTDKIDYYQDHLTVRYIKNGEEKELDFIYQNIKKKKQTKKSYLIYQGKMGLLLSKDNDFPQEVREILDNLTRKKKR